MSLVCCRVGCEKYPLYHFSACFYFKNETLFCVQICQTLAIALLRRNILIFVHLGKYKFTDIHWNMCYILIHTFQIGYQQTHACDGFMKRCPDFWNMVSSTRKLPNGTLLICTCIKIMWVLTHHHLFLWFMCVYMNLNPVWLSCSFT